MLEKLSKNYLIFMLAILLVFMLMIIIYMYKVFDILNSDDVVDTKTPTVLIKKNDKTSKIIIEKENTEKNKKINKEVKAEISKTVSKQVKKELEFKDLDKAIQKKYVLLSLVNKEKSTSENAYKKALNNIKNQNEKLRKKEDLSKNTLDSTNKNKVAKAKAKYEFVKCYTMRSNKSELDIACKSKLKTFIKKHKKAKYFEIIGVVSNDDFTYIKNISTNANLSNAQIKQLKEFAVIGLGRQRIIETSWYVKEIVKNDSKVYTSNYIVTSKANNKGTVLRAYY